MKAEDVRLSLNGQTLGEPVSGELVHEPRYYPMLYSGEMVRAILDGRKTQTRRVIKHKHAFEDFPQKISNGELKQKKNMPAKLPYDDINAAVCWLTQNCPYGEVGDRLWVRETWRSIYDHWHDESGGEQESCTIIYEADGFSKSAFPPEEWTAPDNNIKRPSIFMPRWASRITLEITDVRVERVQDISEEDAKAEGAAPYDPTAYFTRGQMKNSPEGPEDWVYRAGFADLWNSLHEKRGYGWSKNPWVWVVEFRMVKDD